MSFVVVRRLGVIAGLLLFASTASAQYQPSLTTSLGSMSGGVSTTVAQTLTDFPGNQLTVQIESVGDAGSFDLSGATMGSVLGTLDIEFLGLDPAVSAECTVLTVGPDSVSGDFIVTFADMTLVSLLGGLGVPDPTGMAVLTLTITNTPGGGWEVEFGSFSLFPTAGMVTLVTNLVTEYTITPPLTLPAGPSTLTVATDFTSQDPQMWSSSEMFSISASTGNLFQRGDCDDNAQLALGDVIELLAVTFSGSPANCTKACDANDDGVLGLSDAIDLLQFLFSGGVLPGPQGACGVDPVADMLDCTTSNACGMP